MSYYFRERPRFGERFRGKSGDELLQELKQQFGEDAPFFEGSPTGSGAAGATHGTPGGARATRDPFERHTSFPRGFPFDDEGFGRRADIRSHLDDLAARHPEFADHLLGPPWADVPFPGSPTGPNTSSLHRNRNNRRDSADRAHSNAYHNHPDDDARSQASGSSAASGASGVSSHSEPDDPHQHQHQQQQPPFSTLPRPNKSQQIPQYGLRNTLDIGQHQHDMENPQAQQSSQQQRNVRSMSAPPENRNQENGQPRFVSRVEITPTGGPQNNQTQANQQQAPPQREKSPAPQPQQQQKAQAQQQSNVRHIPIFVEGRDKPVIAKDVDETDFVPRRQQSPPQFQRPSHYQQHYQQKAAPAGWSSHFGDPFFEPATTGRWGQPPPAPSAHQQFRHPQEKPRAPQQTHHPEPQPQPQPQQQQQQQQTPRQKPQAPQQPQTPQKQQQQAEPQPEAPPKPRQQIQPKDPLERVALVQTEVDALTEQVKQYTGTSRQDKQYMYLDEMLTRELIKLDDIETEGKENVRQARKQAIRSIQESIGLLESRAPLPGQKQQQQEAREEKATEEGGAEGGKEPRMETAGEEKPAEKMETGEEPAAEEPQQKAIPLPPPCPSSPIKTVPSEPAAAAAATVAAEQPLTDETPAPAPVAQESSSSNVEAQESPVIAPQPQVEATPAPAVEVNEKQTAIEPMDSVQTAPADTPMEVRQSSPAKELQLDANQQQSQALIASEQTQEAKDAVDGATVLATPEKVKKEPPPVPEKPAKSPKKAKKTKKQAPPVPEPVSETAIPLPAPGQSI